ncbi:MAG TPA: NAD(P)-dependent oxidoreductase [Patescibacteria group bacterium]|nr:NAD(P)-dependent oxidoreductase [Patescibacteria group bacterium]
MKVFVTGAAGYLGSVLVPTLLKRGYHVVALDSFMYNQTSLLDCCYDPKISIIRGDARSKDLVKECLKDVDVIIPLACLTGAPLCNKDPLAARSTNYDAIKLILELRSPDQKILFPTTNSGYGVGEAGLYCTEETPLRPVSLYGTLKVDIEKDLLAAGNVITLRLATVFGVSPRMRLDLLVNDFTYRAVFDGFIVLFEAHFKRNYIHIRDVAKAFLHGIDHFEQMKDQPYNVGLSSANISKWELCQEIKKYVPNFHICEAEVGKDPDQRNYIVSNAKLEAQGWSPDYSLQDGIRELLRCYQVIKRNQYANI